MPESRSFVPGDGTLHQIKTPFGPLSGAICYELDFPDLIRPAGRTGTAMLVSPVRTLYATIGDLVTDVCLIGILAILIAGLVRRQLDKKTPDFSEPFRPHPHSGKPP